MRERILVLVALLSALGLTACGSSGSTAPKLIFNNLQAALQAHAGDNVAIQYVTWDDDGPDLPASTSFFADIDGDLTTTGDQVVIALGRTNNDGVNMAFNWNTSGVTPAVYNIVALTVDQSFAVQATAPGKVTVFAFAITKPTVNQNRTVLAGATVNIDYIYNDPDSTPTTDAYADRDGSLGTTDDQYLIAEDVPENGGSQTIAWDTEDVDPGTYFLFLVGTDFPQGNVQIRAQGQVTVITVTAIAPADETTLLSTAYNARISFSQSLTPLGAVVNGATVVVAGESSGTIPGSYTLENGGTEINFEPTAGMFPADDLFSIKVQTSMLFSDAGPTTSQSSEFETSISPVFVTHRRDNSVAVFLVDDPEDPFQDDELDLALVDEPHYAICASDGMMYLSQFEGDPAAYVIAYNLLTQQRGTIPLPPVLGENTTGASGLALSPDEKTLYCAGYEQTGDDFWEWSPFLSVINRASMTETKRIQLNFTGWPRAVTVSPDGKRVYVANLWGGYLTQEDINNERFYPSRLGAIHVIDTATNTEVDTDGIIGNGITPIIPNAPFPVSVAVSSDNKTLYVGHGGGEQADIDGDLNVNISVFNTETFVEGLPLASDADALFSAPNLLFDQQRDLLYAPRSQYNLDGLSVFNPFAPAEVISSDFPGGVLRDVDLVWGTEYIVLASNNGSGIFIVNVLTLDVVGFAQNISNQSGDVATIPPRRY